MPDARIAYNVTNNQPGPRGIWTEGAFAYVEPGQTVVATLTDDEKALADTAGYFEMTKASKADVAAATAAPAPAAPDAPTT